MSSMKPEQLLPSRARLNCVAVIMILAFSLCALWAAIYGLHVFAPFSYERLKAAVCLSVGIAVVGLIVLLASDAEQLFKQGSVIIKAAGWLSVILALDSLLIEPLLSSAFPRLNLGYSLRWQFQLIVGGLLASTAAIAKRSWRWIPLSVFATLSGIFWLLMILVPE